MNIFTAELLICEKKIYINTIYEVTIRLLNFHLQRTNLSDYVSAHYRNLIQRTNMNFHIPPRYSHLPQLFCNKLRIWACHQLLFHRFRLLVVYCHLKCHLNLLVYHLVMLLRHLLFHYQLFYHHLLCHHHQIHCLLGQHLLHCHHGLYTTIIICYNSIISCAASPSSSLAIHASSSAVVPSVTDLSVSYLLGVHENSSNFCAHLVRRLFKC